MELEIIRFIQSFYNNFWDAFFIIVTMLGEEVFVFLVLTFIYWNYNKEFGKYMAYSAITSININGIIKSVFNLSRPIGELGIRTLRAETATSSSFPSGHTQGVSSILFSICRWVKKRPVYIISFIIVFLVALSRLYLGVHYPKDVLTGGILGFFLPWLCYVLFNRFRNKPKLFAVTFIILLLGVFITDVSSDYIKSIALFGGMVVGTFIEEKYVNFHIGNRTGIKILRWLLGLAIILLIKEGLKVFFPDYAIFDFIRYFLISLITMGVYPMLFNKIKL